MRKSVLAVGLLAALASFPSLAVELSVSGFGQVVAGSTSDDADNFPNSNYDGQVDFKEESLFAVQLTANINDRVSAVAQVMARGNRDFDAELAWAYANIQLGNGFSTRLGRQRTALFRYSDFLDVGYAYPWIRTPSSVYNVGFSTLDGVSFTHTGFVGDWFSQVQFQAGGFEGDTKAGADYTDGEYTDLLGVAWDVEYNDWLAFRAAYFQADISVRGTSLDGLTGALALNGAPGLASALDYNEDRGVFTNIGVRVERNNWRVEAEYTTTTLDDSIFSDKEDWYVSAAYRFGQFTPYVTYGERQGDPNLEILDAVPQVSPFYPLVAGAVLSETYDDRYYSAGVRWDAMDNVAVKFDVTRFETNTDAAITGRADSTAVSAGLVFTF